MVVLVCCARMRSVYTTVAIGCAVVAVFVSHHAAVRSDIFHLAQVFGPIVLCMTAAVMALQRVWLSVCMWLVMTGQVRPDEVLGRAEGSSAAQVRGTVAPGGEVNAKFASGEMALLRTRFVDGAIATVGMREADAAELFTRVAAFASFGFAKSHAAAFARTAFESAWLRLHYPAHYLAGLIRAQPMGFYPVEALIHDARRHGVCVEPVCVNRSADDTTTEPLAGALQPITIDSFIVTPSDSERAIAGSQRARTAAASTVRTRRSSITNRPWMIVVRTSRGLAA